MQPTYKEPEYREISKESRMILHKITKADVITKRTVVCGIKYTIEFPGSLYWKEVNCIECLLIGWLKAGITGKSQCDDL